MVVLTRHRGLSGNKPVVNGLRPQFPMESDIDQSPSVKSPLAAAKQYEVPELIGLMDRHEQGQ